MGALLHDIGKPLCRSGQGTDHAACGNFFLKTDWPSGVTNAVRFHHETNLRRRDLAADSPLWAVRFADRLMTPGNGADTERAHQRGGLPALQSIFTHLNGERPGQYLPLRMQDNTPVFPQKQSIPVTPAQYAVIAEQLRTGLAQIPPKSGHINDLLNLLEDCLSFVPAGTGEEDISLYDHSKITAAVAACVCVYASAQGIRNLRGKLAEQEMAFRRTPAFLLYSADFSGIQKFIFTVANKGALASLRSRSFFLELLMEHYIDEILTACGISRANLLYSGGGHCYLLLPNTSTVTETLVRWNRLFNDWLMNEFNAQLFIAHGWTACCGNELMNIPAEQAPYTAMFRRVSHAISVHKLHRCDADQLRRLNQQPTDSEGRECVVCGRADQLSRSGRCRWCELFVTLSAQILECPVYLLRTGPDGAAFALPGLSGDRYVSVVNQNTAGVRTDDGAAVVRAYIKNQAAAWPDAIRMQVGDYAASREMVTLAAGGGGITRLAVCRMDVDNLGHAFVAGYRRPQETDPKKRDAYLNISRTSAFSRRMSRFFKCLINPVLAEPKTDGEALSVAIVYSGGDDVFLVGAWQDVIEAVLRVRSAFDLFCGGALTISAGVSIHDDHFPIRMAASYSGELEDRAKQRDGKNALALFDPEGDHVYTWTEFETKVMGEKLSLLQRFFEDEDQERGNTFLYQLLAMLVQAQHDKINLARYAYLLAKMEPRDAARRSTYRSFSQAMYQWALSPTDRCQLITAIDLFVYMERKGNA